MTLPLLKITTPQRPQNNCGYSLVEILVAIGLMGVGMAAIMAMQFSALTGYGTTRDQINAAEIARTIDGVLKTEALQWSSNASLDWDPNDGPSAMSGAFSSGTTPFEGGAAGLLSVVTALPHWEWKSLISVPVDQRLVTNGLRRYCAFARAGMMHTNPDDPEILQVQIAVVFPAGQRNFPGIDATNPYGQCSSLNTALLNATSTAAFEATGYRAAYFGTQISPRRRFN